MCVSPHVESTRLTVFSYPTSAGHKAHQACMSVRGVLGWQSAILKALDSEVAKLWALNEK